MEPFFQCKLQHCSECCNIKNLNPKSILRTQTYQPRRLNVFENRVLRRIFEPKRDKVTGEWKKLHNEELNDRYCS